MENTQNVCVAVMNLNPDSDVRTLTSRLITLNLSLIFWAHQNLWFRLLRGNRFQNTSYTSGTERILKIFHLLIGRIKIFRVHSEL